MTRSAESARKTLSSKVWALSYTEALNFYQTVWAKGWEAIAALALEDRYFLLTHVCGRKDALHPWLYARCREVEQAPDDYLDLWSREHYKSTIITFAGAVQEIIRDPEITIGIFSFNNSSANKFLKQIKRELESNEILKTCFPNVLYAEPQKHSKSWSEQNGIIVKRKSNPKEGTVEANGLIDGMPTGAHYKLRIYDDVITEDHARSPEMIEKATNAWRLSQNLGSRGGKKWHVGTRYHFNDTYRFIMNEEILKPRIYPGTEDGTPTGKPVLLTQKELDAKRKEMGPYIFGCQILQNPVADDRQGFSRDWIRHYISNKGVMNKYLLCDPANEKKKTSDYTVFAVIGLGADRNYYLLDLVRDRLNLRERTDILFRLHRQWKPKRVGYEKYGKDSDIEHFTEKMADDNYRFDIVALGGKIAKEDRIRKLVPVFENGRFYLPEVLYYTDFEGKKRDLVRDFIDQEYMGFPMATHDDMFDCIARILDKDMSVVWPKGYEEAEETTRRDRYQIRPRRKSWMAL